MPIAKQVLNAFTATEVASITGISLPMISYLLRAGFLTPTYAHGERGRVRYYSYRDLAIARIIQRLRDAGVELTKLKPAVQKLTQDKYWNNRTREGSQSQLLQLLVTDGKKVYFKSGDGFLEEIGGQRSFAFVVNLRSVEAEIWKLVSIEKRKHFSMDNREMMMAQTKRTKSV